MDKILEGVAENLPVLETAVEEKPPKIRLERWSDNYTLVGAPVAMKSIEEAADLLAQSRWMQPWLAMKIREALMVGEKFTYEKRAIMNEGGIWKGRPDGIVAEWRVATKDEVLNYVDSADQVSISGHSISRRAQERGYILHYHEGPDIIRAYDNLPRQAKVILDILNSAGRDNFTEASIEVLLTEQFEQFKSKQTADKLFGFYRRRLIDEGHLEELD